VTDASHVSIGTAVKPELEQQNKLHYSQDTGKYVLELPFLSFSTYLFLLDFPGTANIGITS
jgi:hypothetical protein